MTPEKAEQMLRGYKPNIGRVHYLTEAIAQAERDIERWRANLADDLIASSSGSSLDGMPHGTTVGNPTERLALMLASGFTPGDLKEAEHRLAQLRDELRTKQMMVSFVRSWVAGLTAKESWLIERIYFENCTYNETARAYEERYGSPISRDGIRRMKKVTVEKIAAMAK